MQVEAGNPADLGTLALNERLVDGAARRDPLEHAEHGIGDRRRLQDDACRDQVRQHPIELLDHDFLSTEDGWITRVKAAREADRTRCWSCAAALGWRRRTRYRQPAARCPPPHGSAGTGEWLRR